ncbi:repetitive organellar protein-like [Hydra vulgaris]|uniref:repetitive organellar protein-like n=1 Tax=Hydra vulgaris TaxID=6087 RepID=UPI0032EA6938
MASKKEIEIIMEEKFKAQESSLLKIVSGNASIQNDKMDKILHSIENITNRISKVEKKQQSLQKCIDDLQKSIEFTQDTLINEKLVHVEKELKKLMNTEITKVVNQTVQLKTTQIEASKLNDALQEKIRKLEDRNRRNNIKIDGVRENEKETWDQTEKKVQQIFNDQLKISNIIIERAHRIERRFNAEKIKNKPRTIILKLLNYKDKEKILENAKMLKGTGIFINEDFSFETNKIRRELSEKMKIERNAGKYAIIEYDKLIVREFNLKAK